MLLQLRLAFSDVLMSMTNVCFAAGEDAVRSAFVNVDQAGIGSLTEHQFEAALRQAGIQLSRHQIISLHRRLAKDGKVQVEDVLRVLI